MAKHRIHVSPNLQAPVERDRSKISKNARAEQRGATAALTPHVCPACHERVPQNQLLVVMPYTGGKRGRTQGYHQGCYRLAS